MSSDSASAPPSETEVAHCYRCGAALPEGALHCPYCGRPQFRVCRCGNRNPLSVAVCPVCGLDQSRLRRGRRKLRREKMDAKTLAKYAVAGTGITLLVFALVNGIITNLAQQALPAGDVLPPDLGTRAALASHALAGGAGALGARLGQLMVDSLPVLLTILIGAAGGAVVYLIHKGVIPLARTRRRRHHDHSRRRRA